MRTHLTLTLALVAAIALAGCGLTPKQLQALDGAMCTKTTGYGITNTTAFVAGASKNNALGVNGDTCSIMTQGSQK